MKILNYLLTGIVATLPMLWLENYTLTNPIWWTVISAWIFGNLFGYLEGKKTKEDSNND